MRRENRITSARDFRRVRDEGRRGMASGVMCFLLSGEGDRPVRVGISAGRRIGGSVVRNRAKRLLREAARRLIPDLDPGTEVLLVATPEISGKSCQAVLRASRDAVEVALNAGTGADR